MTPEQQLLAAITVLAGVVVQLWRLNQQKDAEIKALMREMIGLAKDVRKHLQNGQEKPSRRAEPPD